MKIISNLGGLIKKNMVELSDGYTQWIKEGGYIIGKVDEFQSQDIMTRFRVGIVFKKSGIIREIQWLVGHKTAFQFKDKPSELRQILRDGYFTALDQLHEDIGVELKQYGALKSSFWARLKFLFRAVDN